MALDTDTWLGSHSGFNDDGTPFATDGSGFRGGGMGEGWMEAFGGDGQSWKNSNVSIPGLSAEESELVNLSTQLAKRQLANIDSLMPFQQEMLKQSYAELQRQGRISGAMSGAITPEMEADLMKQDFERARKLGPIQDQLLQAQLDAMQGKISPQQQAAMDAAIAAGEGDIDRSTQSGIGMIADELANSRGMRLSDSPIMREAGLLAEKGQELKKSLAQNIRATGMTAFPQMSAGIGLNQQAIADAAKSFQADLRQRASSNRMALFGGASQSGIGLAGVGGGAGSSALSSLSGVRAQMKSTSERGFDPAAYLSGHGQFGQGSGSFMKGLGGLMGGMG